MRWKSPIDSPNGTSVQANKRQCCCQWQLCSKSATFERIWRLKIEVGCLATLWLQIQLRLPNASFTLQRTTAVNLETIGSSNSRADIMRQPPPFFGSYSQELETNSAAAVSFSILHHRTSSNFWRGADTCKRVSRVCPNRLLEKVL